MNKKITIFMASNTGSAMRKLDISKTALGLTCGIILIALAASAYVFFDYFKLRTAVSTAEKLEKQVDGQRYEIASQRKQIQRFAAEINALKTKLVDLNNFEKKIRIIANIEQTIEQDAVFGVGGSIPEDLDVNLLLSEKHSSLLREMHEQIDQLSLATGKQAKGFESLINFLHDQRNLLASTPAISPTKGWITSRFGYRKSPFTGLREFHKGLDIATRTGTPIIATADGVVTYAGKKGLLGNLMVIDHGHGMVTRYAHLHKFLKKRGAAVKRGDPIAEVGNSGRSTGPHLHYDVRLNGISVNPEKYILN